MRLVRLLVSVFLQFLFGIFGAGGCAGLIAILSHWRKTQEDEHGILVGVGLLCALAIFVGIKGVFVAKKRARGEVIGVREWNDHAHRGALGNIIAGSLLVIVGVGWYLILLRATREVHGEIPIWSGPIAVGLSQLIRGIVQCRSRAKDVGLESSIG